MARRRTRPHIAPAPVLAVRAADSNALRIAHGVARAALVVYAALTGVVLRLHPAGVGLDPSWAVALNYLHAAGFRHGRDIAFTYGPLAILSVPMDFGTNLLVGALFQAGAWIVFAAALAWLVYARGIGAGPLALFAFLLYLGIPSFHRFGYAGPDVFIVFLAVLLLAGALEGRHWYGWYGAAVGLAALLALIKWSSGLEALGVVLLFGPALALFDRRRAVRATCMGAAAALVTFSCAYLLYNPSFSDMLRYVRAGLALSAGYSAALSSGGEFRDVVAALLIAAIYVAWIAWLYVERQRSCVLALALLPALFLEFKHSFVRYAGHIDIYFCFAPLIFGLIFLFTRLERRSRWMALIVLPLLAGMSFRPQSHATSAYILGWASGIENAAALRQLSGFERTRARLRAESAAALDSDRLPVELLARLGTATVTAFPWEVSYAAANPIRYVPFPIFNSFMAYTPYLDEWNAAFFRDSSRAPAFVLLEWMAIDGRNPLLDAPAAFTALFQNYDFDSQFGERVLLRRRDSPRFTRDRSLRTERVTLGRPIRFEPSHARPLIARVHVAYNLRGRALRFLFRIPEMRAAHSSDSSAMSARISTEVTADGMPLNFLPADLTETVELFRSGRMLQRTDALVISGQGLANFQPEARVDVYEFADGVLDYAPAARPPDLTQLHGAGNAAPSRIETLSSKGVTGIAANEVIDVPDTTGYVQADGFAIDPGAGGLAGSAWIRLDDALYAAGYGIEKPGVAALLGSARYTRSGFSWTYPAWKLGSIPHTVSLVVVSKSGKVYYEGPPVRFRMIPASEP